QRIILEGDPPSPVNPPSGCRFRTRCPYVQEKCKSEDPKLMIVGNGHSVACHYPVGV
ncbi:MAG TPA: oligopeptide/dipeptide ABC transporter ATP-binding protein, partial [Symbiobacteriaceae bacterium]|nr:oligopeptide/dipeptide ABC transporter ATP-binding protein [Symbiobacteriaceae bacterium]